MLWDEPKIFFLERRYFFSIILSEFLKNRVALQYHIKVVEKNDGFVVEVYEMKKILVLSLCFVLALWMAGCVQNKNINFGDVTMKVVEGSVTPSGLTVRISNNTGIDINGGINYDFSIEKKEDDKWSPVKEIGDRTTDTETYIFQGERDLNINWSEIYGSLSAGEYRVVKFFYPSTEDGSYGTDDGFYLFAEFSIE